MNKTSEPAVYTLKEPYTFRMLDISTGHMSATDDLLLKDAGNTPCPVSAYPYGPDEDTYGYLVHIDPEYKAGTKLKEMLKSLKDAGFSEAFCNIYRGACERSDIDYIRFDRDGAQYDLPTFDW